MPRRRRRHRAVYLSRLRGVAREGACHLYAMKVVDRRVVAKKKNLERAAAGVAYVHMMGIVYRNLKLENVLIRADGHTMLIDFDLSLESTSSVSRPGRWPRQARSRASLQVSMPPFLFLPLQLFLFLICLLFCRKKKIYSTG